MTIETLYQHFLECESVCTDTRKITQNTLFFALKGANFNGNEFAEKALKEGAKFAVIDEPKYQQDNRYLLVENVLKSLQQLATQHRKALNNPIISLTGSNGKTTTKELINAVLSQTYTTTATKGNLNNHIGVPLTLLSMTDATEIGIVEMGANHVGEIAFLSEIAQPDYGLITNFGKAHLEGFGGVEGVIKGKSELYDYLKAHDKTIFINVNDPMQLKQVGDYDTIIKFGNDVQLLNAQPYLQLSFRQQHIKSHLTGTYNFNNIAVAIAIGQHFKVPDTLIKKAIEAYVPNNNRSQIIHRNNHQVILDAYNANPTSMMAALSNFELQDHTRKIAILGDMFELGAAAKAEHQSVADYAHSLNLQKLILVGEHFSSVDHKFDDIAYYKSFEDFKSDYSNFNFTEQLFLIKGSRGMALERIIDLL